MIASQLSPTLRRYLNVLNLGIETPSKTYLDRLVRAHLYRVPFENISKLYYLQSADLRDVPSLDLFLDGIEKMSFGGTCYTNNPYFGELLHGLGFDLDLCGADMTEPDVHTALNVRIEGREYLVDLGYGAAFDHAIPRDLDRPVEISFGNHTWVIRPQDKCQRSRVEHHRQGQLIHGYLLKPKARAHRDFGKAISDSFRPESTFMRNLRVIRYSPGASVTLSGMNLIRSTATNCDIQRLSDTGQLLRVVEDEFSIPRSTTSEAIRALSVTLE